MALGSIRYVSCNCNAVHLQQEWSRFHGTANHAAWPGPSPAILAQNRRGAEPGETLRTVNARHRSRRRPASPKFAFKTIAAGAKMKKAALPRAQLDERRRARLKRIDARLFGGGRDVRKRQARRMKPRCRCIGGGIKKRRSCLRGFKLARDPIQFFREGTPNDARAD